LGETAKVSQPVVRLRDNRDFIEEQRKAAILRRRMILVMKGIEPWDFPKDWDSDLLAPDWIPPRPEQIQEQRDYMYELAKKGRPMKPVHVPPSPNTAS
jgi:hypothetical protein